jgi:hypothetical protein
LAPRACIRCTSDLYHAIATFLQARTRLGIVLHSQPSYSSSRLNTRGDFEAIRTCASQAVPSQWHCIIQARTQGDAFYHLPSWSLPVRGCVPTPRPCQGSTMVVEKATNPHACIRRAQNRVRPMLRSPSRWDSCREAQTTIEGSALLLRTEYKNRFFTACEDVDHPYTSTTHQTSPKTPQPNPSEPHHTTKMACDSASCKCTTCTCQPGSCKCSSCNTKVHKKRLHGLRWAQLTSL